MDLKAAPSVAFIVSICLAAGAGCSSQKTRADSRIYSMGERVQVGPLIYRVMDTQWRSQLGEAPNARIPRDRFVIVRLSVTNSGVGTSSIPAMKLVDAGGHTYDELTEGQGVPEWLGYLRNVKPAETEHGRVLFDLPRGSYRLVVADDAEPENQKTALIDIPLQLGPPSGGLPAVK